MPRKKEHILDFLDFASLKILQALKESDLSFTKLNERAPLTTPNFNNRLTELIKLGLITEVLIESEKGRKKKVYSLTDKGRKILELLEEIERVYYRNQHI